MNVSPETSSESLPRWETFCHKKSCSQEIRYRPGEAPGDGGPALLTAGGPALCSLAGAGAGRGGGLQNSKSFLLKTACPNKLLVEIVIYISGLNKVSRT